MNVSAYSVDPETGVRTLLETWSVSDDVARSGLIHTAPRLSLMQADYIETDTGVVLKDRYASTPNSATDNRGATNA